MNTDNIILPASANLIGSGWNYTTGWTPLGATGGYVTRNNNGGGIEFYTGKSNTLGMNMTITSNGNIGVATYTPEDKLHVVGSAQLQGTTTPGSGIYSKCKWLNPAGGYGGLLVSHEATYGNQSVIDNSVNPLDVVVEGSTRFCVQKATGRTGINTSNPQYTCHVAGTFFSSNISSPTIDTLSNASFPAYSASIFASNVSIWSSNQFGGWLGVGLTLPSSVGWYNSVVPLSGAAYALLQTDVGATAINAFESNAVYIRSHGRNVACFSNYAGDILGSMTVRSNLDVEQYTTLKKGNAGAGGTFTHLPFSGDGKYYIRGDVILADNGGNVGIGTTSAGDKLTVNGTTATSALKINSGATISHLRVIQSTIPRNGSGKLILTLTGTFPSSYELFPTVRTSDTVSDNFCVTVMSTSTTAIKLSIVRTDGGSWGNLAELTLLLIG